MLPNSPLIDGTVGDLEALSGGAVTVAALIRDKGQRYIPGEHWRLLRDDIIIVETDPEKAAEAFVRMNDILIENVVIIPLVQRSAESIAINNKLDPDMFAASPWETLYWNMANWYNMSE